MTAIESCCRALLLAEGPQRAALVLLALFPAGAVMRSLGVLARPDRPEALRVYASEASGWVAAQLYLRGDGSSGSSSRR